MTQDDWNSLNIHAELLTTQDLVYSLGDFVCSSPIKEKESTDYGAYSFELNSHRILFRVAKTTPTKIGQFVTLWKRQGDGPIQPYDRADAVDFFVICVRKNTDFGQFVFPASVLGKQGVLSKSGKGGKRAMRVYPPWDKTTSPQARKTQVWQLEYFLLVPQDGSLDLVRAQALYRAVD